MEGGKMTEIGEMPTKRYGTRMTRITRIFADMLNPCTSASSVQSVFYRNPLCRVSAFIMPKPCGFSTPRTRMPCGAYVDMPFRGGTLGVHLRLIFSRKRQEALAE